MIDSVSSAEAFGQAPPVQERTGSPFPSEEQHRDTGKELFAGLGADPELANIPGLREMLQGATAGQNPQTQESPGFPVIKNEASGGNKPFLLRWLSQVFHYLTNGMFQKNI